MTHTRTVRSLLLRLLSMACLLVCAQAEAGNPAFVSRSIMPSSRAEVLSVRPAPDCDVVYLRGGYDQGLRTGMTCTVVRDSQLVARLVLVEVRPEFSAALILDLPQQGVGIRNGDIAQIQTLRFSQ